MSDLFPVQYSWLIPLLPLVGAAVAGFGGARWLKQRSHWPIWIGVGASALLSIWLLVGMLGLWHAGKPLSAPAHWFTWIASGGFVAEAGAWIDPLTAVMLCVVTGIGFLITVFSKGYMHGEDGYFRFFAYLGLFIFAMTCLVMGNNFLMLYLGWEGVGLCSYLLIGYYYERPAAREAAKKAFIVNRVGDFGFALGIMLIFLAFNTINYFTGGAGDRGVLGNAALGGLGGFQGQALNWIPFLLMLGAFGKSAQFPLHVWLPDAMEGPTPVSALIHAATMVTAGVYMIARCSTLFVGNVAALWTVAAIGAFTALLAATIALRQFDLKKVFAYSTISQLGFMFVGAACLAPVAGVFHLVTHAFFKALLFLSSGVVMHAMMGVLDMRKMSGLRRVLPKTNILMLIGCAALAGFPFLAGFFSKDEIVHAAFEFNFGLGLVMLVTAFLTAYYTFRLYFRVFQGPEIIPEPEGHGHPADQDVADEHAHASAAAVQTHDVHESGNDKAAAHHDAGHAHNHEPAVMIWPLVVLAIGALLAGYLNWPEWEHRHSLGAFLAESKSFAQGNTVAHRAFGDEFEPRGFGLESGEAPHFFTPVMGISAVVAILGIWLAYRMHLRDRRLAETVAKKFEPFTGWIEAKYWIDELYQGFIIEPLRAVGRFFFAIDRYLIDGIVWLVGFVPQAAGFALKLGTQRGSLQGYAMWMLFGILIILLAVFW